MASDMDTGHRVCLSGKDGRLAPGAESSRPPLERPPLEVNMDLYTVIDWATACGVYFIIGMLFAMDRG